MNKEVYVSVRVKELTPEQSSKQMIVAKAKAARVMYKSTHCSDLSKWIDQANNLNPFLEDMESKIQNKERLLSILKRVSQISAPASILLFAGNYFSYTNSITHNISIGINTLLFATAFISYGERGRINKIAYDLQSSYNEIIALRNQVEKTKNID